MPISERPRGEHSDIAETLPRALGDVQIHNAADRSSGDAMVDIVRIHTSIHMYTVALRMSEEV